MTETTEGQVPPECTLPTAERPLRLAEFDRLFATSLRDQTRVSSTVLRWEFPLAAEDTVRDLTARESACCSFFDFDITTGGDGLLVEVRVPSAQRTVLDGLQALSGGLRE